MVTVAAIRASESCNTLLEIVGFTTPDACEFMLSFFTTKENGTKVLKPTRAGDSFPKFNALLLPRCCDVASRSTFATPFVSRFYLQILKEKTKRNPLPLSNKQTNKNKQYDILLVLDGLDELPKRDGQT